MSNSSVSLSAGIDVAKHELVVATAAQFNDFRNDATTFPNTDTGCHELLTHLRDLGVGCVVLEASGSYERRLLDALAEQDGIIVHYAQPRAMRHLIKGLGQLEKTDALDAQALARAATLGHLAPWTPQEAEIVELRALVDERAQLLEARRALEQQCEQARQPSSRQQTRLQLMYQHLKELEALIRNHVSSHDTLKRRAELMLTMPGIGEITTWTLLAYLPELGTLNRAKISKLAGLAPLACDSGLFQGPRRTRKSRPQIKAALWMASVAAVRFDEEFRAFRERLIRKGKPPKVARTAVMRKMLIRLNAMLRDDQGYQAQKVGG